VAYRRRRSKKYAKHRHWKRSEPVKFDVKLLVAFTLLVVTSMFGFGNAYAWLSSQNTASNIINTPVAEVAIVEGNTLEDLDGWTPQNISWGNDVLKYVRFSNTGQSTMLIRATYAQTWKTGTTYLSNLAKTDSGYVNVAQPQWTVSGFTNDSLWWYNTNDGWYYYRKILEPGESTDAVMDKVTFISPEPPGYNGAEYSILFRLESCQYSSNPENENQLASWLTFGTTYTESSGTLTWSTTQPTP
jgi:alternate signal-mediated exported protein